jgi:hypothetical protein
MVRCHLLADVLAQQQPRAGRGAGGGVWGGPDDWARAGGGLLLRLLPGRPRAVRGRQAAHPEAHRQGGFLLLRHHGASWRWCWVGGLCAPCQQAGVQQHIDKLRFVVLHNLGTCWHSRAVGQTASQRHIDKVGFLGAARHSGGRQRLCQANRWHAGCVRRTLSTRRAGLQLRRRRVAAQLVVAAAVCGAHGRGNLQLQGRRRSQESVLRGPCSRWRKGRHVWFAGKTIDTCRAEQHL